MFLEPEEIVEKIKNSKMQTLEDVFEFSYSLLTDIPKHDNDYIQYARGCEHCKRHLRALKNIERPIFTFDLHPLMSAYFIGRDEHILVSNMWYDRWKDDNEPEKLLLVEELIVHEWEFNVDMESGTWCYFEELYDILMELEENHPEIFKYVEAIRIYCSNPS